MQLRYDLRYASRMLRRSPILTAVAVISLALGIGANTAIFSVIDALMLRMLPIQDPEHLVRIVNPNMPEFGFPYPQYEQWRNVRGSFSGLSAIFLTDRSNITVNGDVEPRPLHAGLVSGDYFSTLGLASAVGTLNLEPQPVTVISYSYWERRFGLASDVLSRTVSVNDVYYNIVGVTPRGFYGDTPGKSVDLWFPLAMQSRILLERPDGRAPWLNILGRIKPGVSSQQAQAEAQVVYLRTVREMDNVRPDVREAWLHKRVELEPAARGFASQRKAFAQPLTIVMIVTGLVLLIACANVANLLLARSAGRQREIGIRLALGATRGRIARQLLTESVLLAMLGGVLAMAFAVWGTSALMKFAASGLVSFSLELQPDARMLGFTAALSLLTGLLFGLAPAIRFSGVAVLPALTGSSDWAGRFRIGQLLVVLQVSISLMLLIGAGLFVRTLHNLKSQDLGLEREHLLLIWTAPDQAGRRGPSVASLFAAVPQRISSLPGVISASASLIGPLEGAYADESGPASLNIVSPGFFETVGMRMLNGRDFTARDNGTTPPVGVINEAMARGLFGDENPIGKRFTYRRSQVEIVGVVSGAKYNTLRDKSRRMFYIPYTQDIAHLFEMCIAARTAGNSPALTARIRDEIRSVDQSLPVLKMNSIAEQIDQSLLQERFIALLASLFGTLALLLACLGLYGVLSYDTARRTSEIGIRMALGATRGEVLVMILQESLLLVLAGLSIGIPVTLAATRLISARLFGISPADPLTIVAATALMMTVAFFAGFLPARRAARVEPMSALWHH